MNLDAPSLDPNLLLLTTAASSLDGRSSKTAAPRQPHFSTDSVAQNYPVVMQHVQTGPSVQPGSAFGFGTINQPVTQIPQPVTPARSNFEDAKGPSTSWWVGVPPYSAGIVNAAAVSTQNVGYNRDGSSTEHQGQGSPRRDPNAIYKSGPSSSPNPATSSWASPRMVATSPNTSNWWGGAARRESYDKWGSWYNDHGQGGTYHGYNNSNSTSYQQNYRTNQKYDYWNNWGTNWHNKTWYDNYSGWNNDKPNSNAGRGHQQNDKDWYHGREGREHARNASSLSPRSSRAQLKRSHEEIEKNLQSAVKGYDEEQEHEKLLQNSPSWRNNVNSSRSRSQSPQQVRSRNSRGPREKFVSEYKQQYRDPSPMSNTRRSRGRLVSDADGDVGGAFGGSAEDSRAGGHQSRSRSRSPDRGRSSGALQRTSSGYWNRNADIHHQTGESSSYLAPATHLSSSRMIMDHDGARCYGNGETAAPLQDNIPNSSVENGARTTQEINSSAQQPTSSVPVFSDRVRQLKAVCDDYNHSAADTKKLKEQKVRRENREHSVAQEARATLLQALEKHTEQAEKRANVDALAQVLLEKKRSQPSLRSSRLVAPDEAEVEPKAGDPAGLGNSYRPEHVSPRSPAAQGASKPDHIQDEKAGRVTGFLAQSPGFRNRESQPRGHHQWQPPGAYQRTFDLEATPTLSSPRDRSGSPSRQLSSLAGCAALVRNDPSTQEQSPEQKLSTQRSYRTDLAHQIADNSTYVANLNPFWSPRRKEDVLHREASANRVHVGLHQWERDEKHARHLAKWATQRERPHSSGSLACGGRRSGRGPGNQHAHHADHVMDTKSFSVQPPRRPSTSCSNSRRSSLSSGGQTTDFIKRNRLLAASYGKSRRDKQFEVTNTLDQFWKRENDQGARTRLLASSGVSNNYLTHEQRIQKNAIAFLQKVEQNDKRLPVVPEANSEYSSPSPQLLQQNPPGGAGAGNPRQYEPSSPSPGMKIGNINDGPEGFQFNFGPSQVCISPGKNRGTVALVVKDQQGRITQQVEDMSKVSTALVRNYAGPDPPPSQQEVRTAAPSSRPAQFIRPPPSQPWPDLSLMPLPFENNPPNASTPSMGLQPPQLSAMPKLPDSSTKVHDARAERHATSAKKWREDPGLHDAISKSMAAQQHQVQPPGERDRKQSFQNDDKRPALSHRRLSSRNATQAAQGSRHQHSTATADSNKHAEKLSQNYREPTSACSSMALVPMPSAITPTAIVPVNPHGSTSSSRTPLLVRDASRSASVRASKEKDRNTASKETNSTVSRRPSSARRMSKEQLVYEQNDFFSQKNRNRVKTKSIHYTQTSFNVTNYARNRSGARTPTPR
ncbi:unnamed protein product [Amoebophrya sp. A120]|nr:unnamed protein product [Amoebophrya sp. A120]|eukprot:GSA120T00005571001.1